MRRIVVVTALSALAACSGGTSPQRAAEQEKAELAACRTTYPERPGLFASRVKCELGAAANYVQLTDAGENPKVQKLAEQLGADAAGVDTGALTPDQWRAKLSQTVDALPNRDRRVKEGARAIL